jgi:hypothetical protein
MNIDWIVISVILSLVATVIATGMFISYAVKHINEDKSQDD